MKKEIGKKGTRVLTSGLKGNRLLKSKRSAEKYYLIVSIILGMILLVIALYWIFQEYFTQGVINQETCRQSIILRGTVPDAKLASINWGDLKGNYPLKCKNDVLEIDYKDVPRAEKEIADKLVECWSMFGNGNQRIFPEKNWETYSDCVPCSRIHFDSEVKDYYVQNYNNNGKIVDNRINTERMIMQQKFSGSLSYFEFLQKAGENAQRGKIRADVQAFIGNVIFDDASSNTNIDRSNIDGLKEVPWDTAYKVADIKFPKFYVPSVNGDIIIDFGQFVDEIKDGKGVWASYLFFYYLSGGYSPVTSKDFVGTISFWTSIGITKEKTGWGSKLCENFDGVPA